MTIGGLEQLFGYSAEKTILGKSVNQTASLDHQLQFSRQLQAITTRIHATADIDQIMLDLSREMCALFACDRLTIYAVADDKTSIRSRVKLGMDTFRDFSLPISEASIAGYVALYKRPVNVANVYDEAELATHTPRLQFVRQVDERTGYATRQNLCAPVLAADSHELLGVVQLINSRDGASFSGMVEQGVAELCDTLAVAFAQRMKPPVEIRTKYDPLVARAIIDAAELGLAARSARRKGIDIEDVLVHEFQIKPLEIGLSLSQFFRVPYEPYRAQRNKPAALLALFDRDTVEFNRWLPLEDAGSVLKVLTTDPERVMASGRVSQIFSYEKIIYCVTTAEEFRQTVEQFFDGAPVAAKGSWGFEAIDGVRAAEQSAADRVHAAIADIFRREDMADIAVTLQPQVGKTVSRFRKNGALESIRGSTVIEYQLSFPSDEKSG